MVIKIVYWLKDINFHIQLLNFAKHTAGQTLFWDKIYLTVCSFQNFRKRYIHTNSQFTQIFKFRKSKSEYWKFK